MAIDVTDGIFPQFVAATGAGTTCTQIRAIPYSTVQIRASGAIFVFNDVADGGTGAGSTARLAVGATEAAAGITFRAGGAIAGATYATVCIAAQASTVNVEVIAEQNPIIGM